MRRSGYRGGGNGDASFPGETRRILHRGYTGLFYDGIPVHAPPGVHEEAFTLLRAHLAPPARVLELGAGSGAFTKRLLNAGFQVEAVDLDPNGWPHEDVPLHVVDLNEARWPLPELVYDAVVAVEVIEHLENPSAFLRACRRHLRPGGLLVLTTPKVASLASRRALILRGHLAFFRPGTLFAAGHRTILPWWLLEDLLQLEGYDVVKLGFVGRQPFVLLPGRPWWKRIVTPLVDVLLLAAGREIPREAACTAAVAVVARVR